MMKLDFRASHPSYRALGALGALGTKCLLAVRLWRTRHCPDNPEFAGFDRCSDYRRVGVESEHRCDRSAGAAGQTRRVSDGFSTPPSFGPWPCSRSTVGVSCSGQRSSSTVRGLWTMGCVVEPLPPISRALEINQLEGTADTEISL